MKTNNVQQVTTEAYVAGLIDCYLEARNTRDIRIDTAQAVAQTASEQYVDFLDHLMKNVSAEEFEKFIESNELTTADRVTCIALFAKNNLPEDYPYEDEEVDELHCCCPKCEPVSPDHPAYQHEDDADLGEIGEGFDGREELDKLIKANQEAAHKRVDEAAGLTRLLIDIMGNL